MKAVSCDVLLTSVLLQIWSSVKAFGVLWVDCECHRNPLFGGVWAQHLWGCFGGSLVEIHRNRFAPVEAFPWFHKDKGWTGLAKEDKGTPHALGGSSRDPKEVEGREKSKLTKMAGSGSLASHSCPMLCK